MSNHTPEHILAEKLADCDIKPGDIYYHYRTPDALYKIITLALDEETEEPVIVYQALYGSHLIWTRKLSVWNQKIEIDGKSIPRFTKIQ